MLPRERIQLLLTCLMLSGAFSPLPALAREDRSAQLIHSFMLQVESGPDEQKLLETGVENPWHLGFICLGCFLEKFYHKNVHPSLSSCGFNLSGMLI